VNLIKKRAATQLVEASLYKRARIPKKSLRFFIDFFLPTSMALGSNRPVTEITTRGISPRGKGGRCLGLTTLQTSCAECLEILKASTFWSPKGLSRPVMIMDEPSLVTKNISGNIVES
jgi:hypothetical protein